MWGKAASGPGFEQQTIGAGQLARGGGTLARSAGKLAGRYDLGEDTLYVTEVALAGAQTKLCGQAKLQHVSALFAACASHRP